MADRIKGITIEIDGQTTGLKKALGDVTSQSISDQKELTDVNRLLKFDPGNTAALAQKQELLSKQIEVTSQKLKGLKDAQSQVEQQFQNGKIGESQYRAFQREIEFTETDLKKLKQSLSKVDEGNGIEKAKKEMDSLAKSTEEAENKSGSLKNKIGDLATSTAKGALVGITATTVAVGGLVKASIEQYSQYEQLTGGVETLFKNSSSTVMQYADEAYKSAGMSANEYMSTITGFSASLLQGLGGDTAKAAEVGNTAVTDMSDNANKMGTSMELIQNAYQGFAKSNYTMLDNLKLGYGGTKEEMQRLLTDAEKISGVKYDISNFSDVINAIHTMQTQMGITGTTAKEAASTIEGSLNMTKSASKNLLTGMSDDNADFDKLIDNMVDSASAFGTNIIPRIEIAINGIAQLIEKLLPPIIDKIPQIIMNILPGLVTAGMQIIQNLVTGIQNNLPTIMTTIIGVITTLVRGFMQILPQLLTIGMQIIAQLISGIGQALPTLIPTAVQCITDLVQGLIDNLPLILNAGLQLLEGLTTGIINALPQLIQSLPQIVQSIVDFITQSLPQILQSGLTILLAIIDGLVQCLPQLIAMLPQIIDTIINFITQNLPTIIDAGIKVLLALIDGLINALPQLITMLPQITSTIINTLIEHLPELIDAGVKINLALIKGLIQAIPQIIAAMPEIIKSIKSPLEDISLIDIGENIIKGLIAGIESMASGVSDTIKSIVDKIPAGVKKLLDIHSPSRVMRQLGVYTGEGFGLGIGDTVNSISKQANAMADAAMPNVNTGSFDMGINASGGGIGSASNLDRILSTMDSMRSEIASLKDALNIKVDLDGKTVGKMITPAVSSNLAFNSGRKGW